MYHEITISATVPNEQGGEDLVSKDIVLNLENIHFIYKAPMTPSSRITSDLGEMVINQPIPEEKLIEAGLVSIEATEGTTAWFNPKKVVFYTSPELGVYLLMFPFGTRLGVKTTGADLTRLLGGAGSIIT
jgi:hypothetical protein